MKNTVTKIALALVAMISMTGCPGKKKDNNFNQYGYGYNSGYNAYNGSYCNALSGCYGQAGYGQVFTSGLGKIQSSHLNAELALNFSTSSGYTSLNTYSGNTTMVGVMNVYSSSGFCPIPPGQYQVSGSGNFGQGAQSLSFTSMNGVGNGYLSIQFPNNFLTPITTTSIMGPSFNFAIQNSVVVNSPYGSCGVFVME